MGIEDYKPNTQAYREQQAIEKRTEKVISGTAVTKKRNRVKKFADIFIADDVNSVKSYIFMDVLVPKIRDTIEDVLVSTVHAIFGGRDTNRHTSSKVSYRNYYDERDRRRNNRTNSYDSNHYTQSKVGYEFDDIILKTKGEAELVLSNMDDIIERYQVVRVADLYEMVGISGNHTDCKYGWSDIRSAEAVRVRDGYLLKLPKALPLD